MVAKPFAVQLFFHAILWSACPTFRSINLTENQEVSVANGLPQFGFQTLCQAQRSKLVLCIIVIEGREKSGSYYQKCRWCCRLRSAYHFMLWYCSFVFFLSCSCFAFWFHSGCIFFRPGLFVCPRVQTRPYLRRRQLQPVLTAS